MKKFVARNVAEVGRDSTAAILRATLLATNFGVDTRYNSAIARNIARNIAPCIRTFRSILKLHNLIAKLILGTIERTIFSKLSKSTNISKR